MKGERKGKKREPGRESERAREREREKVKRERERDKWVKGEKWNVGESYWFF